MFRTVVRNTTLVQRAQEQIENLIFSGALAGDSRLPAERELGKMLGVSRTVVREAVRSLAAKGLVEVRTGAGTFVRHLGADLVKAPLDLLLRASALKYEEIDELRTALEVKIAELAARRARAEDIQAMQETIETLKNPRITAREYAEADVAFHSRLASASQNPLFMALVNSLNDVMIEVRIRAASSLGDVARERAVFYHSEILDRVKAGDVDGARARMLEHLAFAREAMRLAEDGEKDNALGRGRPDREESVSDRTKD